VRPGNRPGGSRLTDGEFALFLGAFVLGAVSGLRLLFEGVAPSFHPMAVVLAVTGVAVAFGILIWIERRASR
jgi:hypothetical protein